MNKPNELNALQTAVLDVVSKAKKPVSRDDLEYAVFRTRKNRNNDRAVQRVIRELRLLGYVITSNSSEPGYKIARTQEEVEHYVSERLKAATQMRLTAQKVRKAFQQRGQLRMAGVQ